MTRLESAHDAPSTAEMSATMHRLCIFGHRYDAPIYDGAPRVEVPEGARCVWCEAVIVADEDGFMYASGDYTHLYCNLRNLLGEDLANEVYAGLLARGPV